MTDINNTDEAERIADGYLDECDSEHERPTIEGLRLYADACVGNDEDSSYGLDAALMVTLGWPRCEEWIESRDEHNRNMALLPRVYIIFTPTDGAIHGFGGTPKSAIADAKAGLAKAGIVVTEGDIISGYKMTGATRGMMSTIEDRGGCVGWSIIDGVACTPEEYAKYSA
ncbi:hypothetical protein [Rhodopseudomonas palustris]|uniref:hypothetical protein n=1 Tax=Rhodopseudomonas palustris TaxID=1076 RepID=UPI001F40CB1A|nr:hypothetical protein [Rhodopseudomonas palustris]